MERHNTPIVLFVTVCLREKDITLASNPMHEGILLAWERANAWHVGWYLIMPDHIHMFCVPGVLHPVRIDVWCKFWKGEMRKVLGLKHSIWQRDCWDTQMRDYDHYVEKRAYVEMNPVRNGLVSRPEEWPYRGEIHSVRW